MAETKYYGIYQGIVTNVKDPEKRGRIKVKCPDVLDGTVESAWCDPCVPVCFDNGGDFFIPPKNEAVWLMFIAGDPNKPVYMGGWWQKNQSLLGTNYTNVNEVRIINFEDVTLTFKEGVLNINVGEGVCDLEIKHNKVTVKGNLVVEGNVSAYTVNAGDVNANVNEKGGGGIVHADTRVDAPNV